MIARQPHQRQAGVDPARPKTIRGRFHGWWVHLRGIRAGRGFFLTLAAAAVRLTAAPQFVSEIELADRVIELMDRRLALMPEVAAVKFHQQQPITDPARERVVLEQSVADAQGLQLEGEAARAIFSLQIRLARAVQEHCFARWQSRAEPPPAARDLVTVLRPELDAIGRELLPAMYLASAAFAEMPAATLRQKVGQLRRHPGTTEELLAELAPSLARMRLTAAPTWATLRRIGVLRIGTTGDYAPFSEAHTGELRGFDIDLVQDLARAWGLGALFVRTSWPTLMSDLEKGRFDLAASGISITAERQRVADFSAAYFFDGKTPIARRADAAHFSSLAKIDQPGVRVIVNPGGTNERFVREQIKRATIIVHPDNRTIFEEIIAGRADVMITDSVEAKLQARRHPELAATTAEPFTRAGKAILLAPSSDLTARVDAWLAPQVTRGEIAARLEQALTLAQ